MIRISTRGRYTLRAMVDLAEHSHNGPVPRRDIARRQEISADYVAQLFRQIQAAGLIESVKGPGGGYRLALDASEITASDVIEAVEGPIAVVHCVLGCPEGETACTRVEQCPAHLLWVQLSESMTQVLGSVTLEDLVDQASQLGGNQASSA